MTSINPSQDSTGEAFHVVQPHRDLQQNWSVDLATNLQDYLFKICSGDLNEEENHHLSINFAEAALLLQGSIQVYSRKVEYLYNLVLHALDFISQKRQQDQSEGGSDQPEESNSRSHVGLDEDNDLFWVSDEIPVEAKSSLDSASGKDVSANYFVKPPANLVVLEGDCLDTSSDVGELESYLLATSNLYRNFILLDPCDSTAVDDFLKEDATGKEKYGGHRASSVKSKTRKSLQSPLGCSGGGGSAHKSSTKNGDNVNLNQIPGVHCNSAAKDTFMDHDAMFQDFADTNDHGFDMDEGCSVFGESNESDDDEDDPWRPLDPHEPGNLKVKPFRKVKPMRRLVVNSLKRNSIATQFPLARLHGTISPELNKIWLAQDEARKRQQEGQDPPLYAKLRHSLTRREHQGFHASAIPEVENDDTGNDSDLQDFEQPDMDMPYMDEPVDEDVQHEKHDADDVPVHINATFQKEDQHTHPNLEDLCRSHLDALLASIAETEKQTELAARVSTWKQRIEQNLDEQESRPPFDIHDYGERILGKLSHEAGNGTPVSFFEVVGGQEKHDVARTFSALLQLVNNGDVDLERGGINGEPVCYTSKNPFNVRLLDHRKNRKEVNLASSRKRVKSPLKSGNIGPEGDSGRSVREKTKNKFSMKLAKANFIRCTPESKRRRRSQLLDPGDLHNTG